MAVTTASLRATFPVFADVTKYPEIQVQFWLTHATGFVNAEKWGDQADYGVMLFTCHMLSVSGTQTANSRGRAGAVPGILTSKSVDGVSASYDVSSAMLEGAGHWNLSTFGLQFRDLSRLMGHGPVQVGVDTYANAQAAWNGVIYPPF